MGHPALTLELPEELYERVRRTAKGMKQPMEIALANIVKAATPTLEKVPLEYRAELEAMEGFSDQTLWEVTRSSLPEGTQRRMTRLLDKNQRTELTDQDRQALADLRVVADRLMLKRSYAYLLLKYRGRQIPHPAELK
jgi:hypothetical protein